MRRSRPLLLACATALALALTACGGTAEDVASGGDDGAVSSPTLPAEPDAPPAAGACLEGATDCQDTGGDMAAPPPGEATEVEPTEGLEDLRPIGWEQVDVDPDDQTRVTLTWTSGVAPCNALAEVRVDAAEDAITLTVVEGTVPADEPQACIEIAQTKQTTITLDEEVGPRSILDGADAQG